MSACCNGACRRQTPIRVLMSDLTGHAYAITRWRRKGDFLDAQEKHDVTDDVTVLLSHAWAAGFDAADGVKSGESVKNPYVPEETP